MSIIDFVEQITETDPYRLVLLHDITYTVLSKKRTPSLQQHVSPANLGRLHKHQDILLNLYPELKEHFDNMIGCTTCGNQGSYNFKTLTLIRSLGGVNRDIELLRPITSDLFVNLLKKTKVDKTLSFQYYMDDYYKEKNQLVRQCFSCTEEHVVSANIYLQQYHKDKTKYWVDVKLAIGHLSHAEIECFHINKSLSEKIRIEKLKLKEDSNYIINTEILLKGEING